MTKPERETGASDVQASPATTVDRFRNPYNFVPALPLAAPEGSPLGHKPPVGHDRYLDGHWSGRIGIRIEVMTPLLVPDVSRADTDKNDHKTFGLRTYVDANGVERPLLPVTSLKGPLRAAYEAVTNSRLGVFHGHDAPPARRMNAGEGLGMVPARVVGGGTKIELLIGTHSNSGWPNAAPQRKQDGRGKYRWFVPDDTLYAAWLKQYRRGAAGYDKRFGIRCEPGGKRWPQHGDNVTCWIELWAKGKTFKYWKVRSLCQIADAASLAKPEPSPEEGYGPHHPVKGSNLLRVDGWVVKTNQNIGMKHDERVFFAAPGTTVPVVDLPPETRQRWKNLIRDYRAVFKRDGKRADVPDVSRHAKEPGSENIADGSLCYALFSEDQGNPSLVDVYPVMISRELGHVSPEQMLEPSLLPATEFEHLSPADRVFGWARQTRGRPGISGAWRGQLTIKPIKCTATTEEAFRPFEPDHLPLAILSSPKPSQSRFYLARDSSGTPLKSSDNTAKNGYFASSGQTDWRLRGRKINPHHRLIDPDDPDNYKRTGTPAETKDDQNRSITAWIKPGTVFETEMDVINLASAELGALLWLLDMNRWEGTDQGIAHHRIGGGKPLGFGSVKISLVSVDLRTGEGKQAEYARLRASSDDEQEELRRNGHLVDGGTDLDALVDAPDRFDATLHSVAGLIAEFQREAGKYYGTPAGEDRRAFLSVAFIAAFLQASRGYPDDLPIHYPRLDPEPKAKDENFRWFVDNNKGRKLALGPLVGDQGLPYQLR